MRSPSSRPAEQPGLVPQAGQVAQGIAPVGQQHHQVTQDRAAVMGMATARAGKAEVGAPAKLTGQAQPVGQLSQQHHPGVAADAVGVGGDFESGAGVGSLHRQGDPPGWGMGPSSSRILPAREGPLLPDASLLSAHAKYRG